MAIHPADPNLGFLRSLDAGQSWAPLAEPLAGQLITEFDLSADGTIIYANESDSFRMTVSADGGASWTHIPAPVQGPVRVAPTDPDRVLLAANETLSLSTDGLASVVTVLASSRRFDDIEYAPSGPAVVYAATEGYLVYRSDDGGATWRQVVDLRGDGVLP